MLSLVSEVRQETTTDSDSTYKVLEGVRVCARGQIIGGVVLEGVTKGHKDVSGIGRSFHCLHHADGLHGCVRTSELMRLYSLNTYSSSGLTYSSVKLKN